ncbi:MAG: response regulator transcription factor [Bacteroidia bacterium]|nr:response regulator transcription factor [Bacteroidia bacterium]MBN8691798.1 response regulator transcription factor [Bacteroidota bacterium]
MKLLIADDHPIFRKGLKDLLIDTYPGVEIIECSTGLEAWNKIEEHKPQVSILDINMPEMNGLEVTKKIRLNRINTKVIILTMYKEKEMIRKAMIEGASGFVLKDFAVNELMDCIQKVRDNKKYIGPALQNAYNEITFEDKKKQEMLEKLKNLSQGELKTLKLVNNNKTSKEIAELLFLSEKTIENYRSKICQKLGLPPRNNSLVLWINENKELLSALNEF